MGDEGLRLGPLHQVAQKADDLDASIVFYNGVLGLELIARFDPPGLAFVRLGDTRILLERGAPPATLYLRVADIQAAYATLQGRGVVFEDEPHLIHRDDEGMFGPAGEEEWMTFFRDPAGNWRRAADRQPGAVVEAAVVDVVAGSSAASGGGITTRSMRKLPPMPLSDT